MAFYLPIPALRESLASVRRLRNYAAQSIARYRRLMTAEPNHPRKETMLFHKVFKTTENGDGLTDSEIQSEATTFIIAGSDTTANSLTYLCWSVCRHPAIQDRLTAELAGLPDDFDDHQLKALPYLNQVIDETLRLYSAAPSALPRVVPPGGTTVDGHFIPGGSTISTQPYSLHRDAIAFPSPEEFNPSRWEAPTKEMKDRFMPFGGGSRICIGLHLARMELRLATALFFRSWPQARVSHLEGMSDADMDFKVYVLIAPVGKRCLFEAS